MKDFLDYVVWVEGELRASPPASGQVTRDWEDYSDPALFPFSSRYFWHPDV
jgi:hypothetical protein